MSTSAELLALIDAGARTILDGGACPGCGRTESDRHEHLGMHARGCAYLATIDTYMALFEGIA